jgi:hypothetical protein
MMRTWLRVLMALGLCLPGMVIAAQPPQRLPPVHVQSTMVEPFARWPDSLRQAMRDSLAGGRARWERTRPPQYLVATIATWMMIRPPRDPAGDGKLEAVRVRGDSIVGVVARRAPEFTPAPVWTGQTVDRVFRMLEAEVTNPKRRIVALRLDTVWGFPRSWHTSETSDGPGFRPRTEQEQGGAVVFFEPSRGRLCAWWRRLSRRCPE